MIKSRFRQKKSICRGNSLRPWRGKRDPEETARSRRPPRGRGLISRRAAILRCYESRLCVFFLKRKSHKRSGDLWKFFDRSEVNKVSEGLGAVKYGGGDGLKEGRDTKKIEVV